MNFGRLAGNDSINCRIYDMLGVLDPADVHRFVRKFRSDGDEECFHTYRELILGAHLRKRGWNLRYEQSLGGKTPDWALVNHDGQVTEIIDVVTLHQRRAVDRAIGKVVSSNQSWVGWVSTPPERLFAKLREKAGAYAQTAAKANVPYIIAVFGEFTAPIEPFEVHHVLYKMYGGVFGAVPTVAGTIFFRERHGEYEYHHFTIHGLHSVPTSLAPDIGTERPNMRLQPTAAGVIRETAAAERDVRMHATFTGVADGRMLRRPSR